MLISFCKDCKPLYGDDIRGVITRGRGIKVSFMCVCVRARPRHQGIIYVCVCARAALSPAYVCVCVCVCACVCVCVCVCTHVKKNIHVVFKFFLFQDKFCFYSIKVHQAQCKQLLCLGLILNLK
jgi:hypothetical protein